MDHYGWDGKRAILVVTALGNNTVEIVDQWKRVSSITGLEHPQASQYLSGLDRLVVSSQSGKLRFYDAANYSLIKTLDFGADADTDNMRYDSTTKLLYVGYGESRRGALAAVDVTTMERVQDYPLGSHPESFQLERDGSRIFVNLPDQEAIGVINRKTGRVTKWPVAGDRNSHTLAFDEAAIGCSRPRCSRDSLLSSIPIAAISSQTCHACVASTIFGTTPRANASTRLERARSTSSSSTAPTATSQKRRSQSGPDQAARAFTSRAGPKTLFMCPGRTCSRKAVPRSCFTTSTTEPAV
jgi:hypothetical protein